MPISRRDPLEPNLESVPSAEDQAFALVEGYSDAVVNYERIAELLGCAEEEVEARLASIGLEQCSSCGYWSREEECNIEDEAMGYWCHECAKDHGVDLE